MKNPLHHQITEYDCGPTSLLNAVSYLFEREELPPDLVRNIMLYCLDRYGPDGATGKSGTSHMAMMFLSSWINGFASAGLLDISSRYIAGEAVHLRQDSAIRDALRRGGAAVVRVDLEGWHYVLLTGVQGERIALFDPYFRQSPFPDPAVEMVTDRPFACNRLVPAARMDTSTLTPYAMGPVERREAVLLFNERTKLTEEATVEYMI